MVKELVLKTSGRKPMGVRLPPLPHHFVLRGSIMTNNSEKLLPQVRDSLDSLDIAYTVFECDPTLADTAAFCEAYSFLPSQSANTILVAGKSDPVKYAVCVVLATTKLDVNKKVCSLLGVKRASFASTDETKEKTGMEIGGVTVFGVTNLPIYIDSKVFENTEIVMGGGNRSSKVLLHPKELEKLPNVQIIENLAIPRE